jgi:hypothetical protein
MWANVWKAAFEQVKIWNHHESNQLRLPGLRLNCCDVRGSSGDRQIAPTFRALSPERQFRD